LPHTYNITQHSIFTLCNGTCWMAWDFIHSSSAPYAYILCTHTTHNGNGSELKSYGSPWGNEASYNNFIQSQNTWEHRTYIIFNTDSNHTIHLTMIYININNDICNNTLSENEKPHFINYKQQSWYYDFAAISQERIIFPKQLCYLPSCKYITLYGWHSVGPVAMNGDPSETQLSHVKHLNYLQRLILSHAFWTFFSVITFLLGCHEISISQSLMHTTVWELVLVGIQSQPMNVLPIVFSLMKDLSMNHIATSLQ
jgi:hypothetical protein